MSFYSYKPFKKKNLFPKFTIVFLLGISFALFFANANTIVTGLTNAVQYIQKIVLTSDWTVSWTTGVVLDWLTSKIWATSICNTSLSYCVAIQNLTGSETDPTVASYIKSITSQNITNRTTAYGRWDHATQSYLKTEIDPQVWTITNWKRCIWVGSQVVCTTDAPAWDNLWNHTATANINLASHWLSPDGTNKWLYIDSNWVAWRMWIWIVPNYALDVNGNAIIRESLTVTWSFLATTKAIIGSWYWSPYTLEVAGTGNITKDLLVGGNITATAFYYNSDIRYKEDLESIKNPLDKILSLSWYSFNWKKSWAKSIWIVAQEVERVFPELVNTDYSWYKSVQYGNLVAPLIEAVKELNNKIEVQQQQIQDLQEKLK